MYCLFFLKTYAFTNITYAFPVFFLTDYSNLTAHSKPINYSQITKSLKNPLFLIGSFTPTIKNARFANIMSHYLTRKLNCAYKMAQIC